jgi:hypothetical protein
VQRSSAQASKRANRIGANRSRNRSDGGAGRLYCVEIDGVPVVVFPCEGDAEAATLMRQPWLAEDFASLIVSGRPLWQPGARLSVRPATSAEIVDFDAGAAHTLEEDGLVLVYLIAVDEPRAETR